MKRNILLFLVCQFLAVSLFAQTINVQKQLFVPKETGVYHANQAVALNTRSGQTLVVWQKLNATESVVMARLVNAQGNTVTAQYPVSTTPAIAHPSVCYNPVRNEYLLAYDDNPNVELKKTSIYLQRLTSAGKISGTPVKISTDTISVEMANFFPKVVYNPKNGAYTIIWLREISGAGQAGGGNNGMVGALVTATLTLGGPVVLIQKTVIESSRLWGPITMDVAYHPASNKLLVPFVQVASGTGATQANYYLATLDGSLNNVTPSNIVKVNNAAVQLGEGFAWGARLALFQDTPGFVFYVDSANVKRRKIDLQGKLSGSSIVAFKAPKNNTKLTYPSVAFSMNAKGRRGVLIATQDAFRETGGATMWAQVLDANAIPVGAPIRVELTSATDTALSGLVTPLPVKLTDTLFRFSAYYTLAQFKAPGQTYENSGIVKLNLNVTVP